MQIANPLYDHAFKYLMSNDKLAKKVLATILEKEILELELAQQEIVIEDEIRNFTLYRLDFKALIRDENGRQETVLIEIQKSKLHNNLLRFRSYLGLAYTQTAKKIDADTQKEEEIAYPIISIYILGYLVEDIPVLSVKIDRKIINTANKQELLIKSNFIDMLTHTCYVLQASRLPPNRLSKIEKFMTLFNQAWVVSNDKKFILDLQEVPEGFEDVAAHLQTPLSDRQTIEKLKAEQELESLFAQQESQIAYFKNKAEEERKQKEEERKQKEELLKQSVIALHQTGMNAAQIATALGVNLASVETLMQ